MDGERRLHDLPGSPARRRGAPGRPSPEGTAWRPGHRACRSRPRQVPGPADHEDPPGLRAGPDAVGHPGHGGPARRLAAVHRGARSHTRALRRARPPSRPTGSGARRQGPIPPGPIGTTCADAVSPAPFPSRPTRSATASAVAARAAGRRRSTARTTRGVMPSSAGSIASSATEPSPAASTSSPSDSRRPCSSLRSASGCEGPPSRHAILSRDSNPCPSEVPDPTYHRADSENGDHIDDPSGGRHQRHRVRDRLVAQRAVAAQANKLKAAAVYDMA
jgi:hypothetical protein